MWKKFSIFKKNGTDSIETPKKVFILLIVFLSNLLFYLLVMKPETKEMVYSFPQGFIPVRIESKNLLEWTPMKKVSVHNHERKLLVEEAYMGEKESEIWVRENEVLKLISLEEEIFLLPFQKQSKIKKVQATGEQYEILF